MGCGSAIRVAAAWKCWRASLLVWSVGAYAARWAASLDRPHRGATGPDRMDRCGGGAVEPFGQQQNQWRCGDRGKLVGDLMSNRMMTVCSLVDDYDHLERHLCSGVCLHPMRICWVGRVASWLLLHCVVNWWQQHALVATAFTPSVDGHA